MMKQTCRKSTSGRPGPKKHHHRSKHQADREVDEFPPPQNAPSTEWRTILDHRGAARGLEYLVEDKNRSTARHGWRHWVGIAVLDTRRPDLLTDYRLRLKQAAWTRSNAAKRTSTTPTTPTLPSSRNKAEFVDTDKDCSMSTSSQGSSRSTSSRSTHTKARNTKHNTTSSRTSPSTSTVSTGRSSTLNDDDDEDVDDDDDDHETPPPTTTKTTINTTITTTPVKRLIVTSPGDARPKPQPPQPRPMLLIRDATTQAGEPPKEVREMATQTSLTYFIWDTVI